MPFPLPGESTDKDIAMSNTNSILENSVDDRNRSGLSSFSAPLRCNTVPEAPTPSEDGASHGYEAVLRECDLRANSDNKESYGSGGDDNDRNKSGLSSFGTAHDTIPEADQKRSGLSSFSTAHHTIPEAPGPSEDEISNGYEAVLRAGALAAADSGAGASYGSGGRYTDCGLFGSERSNDDDGATGFEAVWRGEPDTGTGIDVDQSFESDAPILPAGIKSDQSFESQTPGYPVARQRSPPRIFPSESSDGSGDMMAANANMEVSQCDTEDEEVGALMNITSLVKKEEEDDEKDEKDRRKPCAILCICCLLIALCVILALFLSGVLDQKDSGGNNDAQAVEGIKTFTTPTPATQSPTATPVLHLPENTWKAIESNPSGPQARAFDWFWKDSKANPGYTSFRLLQRYVLAVLYFNTGGETWTNSSGWMSDDHECNWFSSASTQPQYAEQGVTPCAYNSGVVTNLILGNNNLTTNQLPEELYLLSGLRQVDLQKNHIQGILSPSILNLTRLARLRVGSNEMTGTIPAEVGRLSELQVLSVYTNQFTGPIPSLTQSQKLLQLWMSSNELTGTLSTELGLLTELQVLWLDQNELSGPIPSEIGVLPKLQDVMLHENSLVGSLPSELGLLGGTLGNLDLRSNEITGTLPTEVGMWSQLNSLVLHQNKISGPLPSEVGNMANLKNLYISSNRLTGTIPTALGTCSNLEILWLNINLQLTSNIPSELGELTLLEDLFLSRGALYGTIPSEIGNMVALRALALQQNVGLSGTLPTELAQARLLNKVNLSRTGLTGVIPEKLCQVHGDALVFDCAVTFCGCGRCVCPATRSIEQGWP